MNKTLSCVNFMRVIMGDIPYITTLCLNGTLPCVNFMRVIMGDIPYITTLCLNGTLPCVGFMDVIMGDIPYITGADPGGPRGPCPPPHKKLLPQIVRRGSRGAKRALAPPYKILDPPMYNHTVVEWGMFMY